jgi:hypothetical protein
MHRAHGDKAPAILTFSNVGDDQLPGSEPRSLSSLPIFLIGHFIQHSTERNFAVFARNLVTSQLEFETEK